MKNSNVKSTVSGDWFYMNSSNVMVRDIDQSLKSFQDLTTEIWEDAGVLELSISDKSSLDFEAMNPYFKDKEGEEYLKKNDIHTLFMVSFPSEDISQVIPIMKHITNHLGGFFCEDTEDFSNVIH